MNTSKQFTLLIKRVTILATVIICSEALAQPEEKPIAIMLGEHEPAGCQLLGRVTGSSHTGNPEADSTPYTNRLIDARNNLRHETRKLGGNTVHIKYANNSGKYEIPGGNKEIVFIGNAYCCE